MNSRLIFVFLAFVVAYYLYYTLKARRDASKYETHRKEYLEGHPEMPEERASALSAGVPWEGMEAATLVELFGQPRRRRLMDPASGRVIWSYGHLFVYLEADKVVAWKTR
jgi:hypothetical protein